jgi:hypothetical protein
MKHVRSALLSPLLLALTFASSIASFPAHADPVNWGTDAHAALFDRAFPGERADCRERMREGSEQVDAFEHQFSLELSYQHAMRAPWETPEQARRLMLAFIGDEYARARASAREGRSADACISRGRALHPVMDSTSPAHEGFQVWDPYFRPWTIADHGDQPLSKENVAALQADPARLARTLRLMRDIDRAGLAGRALGL